MSLGFVPTFSSCVSAFPVPAVAYIGVFASVFRARAGTFVRIDSTFCTFDLPFGFGSLFFVPWVWFSTSIALVWGFGFVFFFRFPLLLLLSLCFVPSIVLASDPRVSTTFTRRSRSIVWFFFFPSPTTAPFDGPSHGISRLTRVWLVSFLPFLLPFFVSTHLGRVQQIDVRLEHHGDAGLGVVRRRTCKRTPTPPAAQSVSVQPAKKDRSSPSLAPPTPRQRESGRGGAGREGGRKKGS